MSASEKLKRLAESEHPLDLPEQGDDHIGGTLHAVLPALIAVVEAAERVVFAPTYGAVDEKGVPRTREVLQIVAIDDTQRALAALDDALGEEA